MLIGQLVVLAGAIGFLAARPAEPRPRHASTPPTEAEVAEGEPPHDAKEANEAQKRAAEEKKPDAPQKAEHGAEKSEHGEGKSEHAEGKAEHGEGKSEHAERKSEPGEGKSEHAEGEAHDGKGEGTGAGEGAGPSSFEQLFAELASGNGRSSEGALRQRDLIARREAIAGAERADAVIVTCTDSRIVPELVFDQPAGSFSVVRVPGAQLDAAGASAVQDAVRRLHPQAVLLMGHVGCHHVRQQLAKAPKKKAARPTTLSAALGGLAAGLSDDALDVAATELSVSFALHELRRRSPSLGKAGGPTLLRVVYEPATGKVRWLDAEDEKPEAEPAAAAPRHGRR